MNSGSPKAENIVNHSSLVSNELRQHKLGQSGCVLWFTGYSGSGKSTLATALEKNLIDDHHFAYVLDGDNVRHGLNRDLGFSAEDRTENIRRISEVANLFADAGIITLTAFISPYRADRQLARQLIGDTRFKEVYLTTPIEVCEARDPKGLYKKARAGDIPDFTGISAPYEPPLNPDITIDTSTNDLTSCVAILREQLRRDNIITA
ncbi:MAG: adenylyl-sulfate kinase [Immundisolibacteraceae bacterium]|nr:adenylyl-sulfate kinase [Immundisolibacteraceae bacterium]